MYRKYFVMRFVNPTTVFPLGAACNCQVFLALRHLLVGQEDDTISGEIEYSPTNSITFEDISHSSAYINKHTAAP